MAQGQLEETMTLEDVLVELAQRRTEFREQSYVPRDFIAKLKKVGIYRSSTPRVFGGEPMAPAEFLTTIERISAVDGSAGWVASFGSSMIYLAALPLQTQKELYRDSPDVAFAGGNFPVQPAPLTDEGYLINGRWKFASGSMGADILGVGIPGDDNSAGKPRLALLRPEQVDIVQDWDVSGMRGTGSFDLKVDNVVVPEEWTFIRGGEPTVDEPLYRYPAIAYAAQVLAVVSAGVARAALDFGIDTGAGRSGVTGAPKLADRAYYRIGVAEAEVALRSARAYFYEATEEAWATVLAGDPVSEIQIAHLRMSSSNVARVAAEAVAKVVYLSGTGTIYNGHPLQWLQRDVLVPQQHAFLGPSMFDAGGAVLMRQPPTVPGFM